VATRVALSTDAPNVRCVHWTGRDRQLVYLVNMGKQRAQGNELLLRGLPAGAVRVLADLKAASSQATFENGVLRVRLPGFSTSCLVEVTGGRP